MVKINKKYLDEACRIRESYIKVMEEIREKENEIMNHKKSIEKIMKEGDEFVQKNKYLTAEEGREKLKDKLIEIDDKINTIVNKLNPLFEKINKLKQEAHELYISIKDKYPELSEAEIQEQVLKSLKR